MYRLYFLSDTDIYYITQCKQTNLFSHHTLQSGTMLTLTKFLVIILFQLIFFYPYITTSVYIRKLDIPARQQWCYAASCPHSGYCGETAFQSSLLYYGNYVSQELVRYADNKACTSSQKLTGECQLLVGVNDVTAATNLKLKYTKSYGASSTTFLSWIKTSLDLGYPVTAGFYVAGNKDPDYDHIMIIIGYETATNNTGSVTALYWNDFSVSTTTRVAVTNVFRSRNTCTSTTQPYCLPLNYNYGIRLQGNTDDTSPLSQSLKVNSWYEPDYSSEDQVTPKPSPLLLTGTLTIRGVVKGTRYSIRRYDRMDYTSSTAAAVQYCFIANVTGTFTYVLPHKLVSDKMYFFRTKINNTCT
jgi:hypothetical protein